MQHIKPRNPLMAAGMSLILPGFGQLYNGNVNKGLLLFIAFTLVTVPLVLWVTWRLPTALTLVLLILTIIINAGIWLFGIVDAYKTARKSQQYARKQWQLPAVYLMIFLVAVFYFVPSVSQYMRANLIQSFSIPSSSMAPSLLQGDVLFANKNYNCPGCAHAVQRGDIAVFVFPNNRTQYHIKRIIGLPGDRIKIEGQQVFVNATLLIAGEPQQVNNTAIITEEFGDNAYKVQYVNNRASAATEFVVPNGEVFMLGDNRNNSKDSRHFGTVPLQDVVGKASQIWLSRGQDGFRWERFGLALK